MSPVPGLGQDLHLHREGAGLHPGALVHNVLGRQWSTRDSTGITRLELVSSNLLTCFMSGSVK